MASKLISFVEDQIRSQYVCYLVDKCADENDRKLNLSRFRIRTVPPTLSLCSLLSKLSLDGNFLSSASIMGLQSLKFLRYLTLNDNELTQFPEELCQLKFVEFLNIGGNPIDRLPEAIDKLKNLITLWCNDMLLEQLPETIGALRKLKTFGARNNQLTALPESFGALRRLRWLTLESNRIAAVPESFGDLFNLTHLNLAKNQFKELPVQLHQLRRLKFCSFANNWIEHVSENVLKEISYIKPLLLHGNPMEVDAFHTATGYEIRFQVDILNENTLTDWIYSLPNSELNLLDTSDEEFVEDLYEFEIPEQARYSLAG